MARFDRLEIDPVQEKGATPPKASAPAERDEKHWLAQAAEDRRKGLYENALRYYSRALEIDKSLVNGWVGQVQMLIQLKEYPEAELWSRKALELFKNNGELLAARAHAVWRMGDARVAQELCDGALRQEGQSAYRWTVRGELMIRAKGDIDRHCFDKAVLIDPDWLVPLEIALVYLYYKVPSKALLRARQAVEKAPESSYCWYVQGVCQMKLEFEDQARKSLQRCLELSPNHTEAGRRLAELKQRGWSLGRSLRRWFGHS
jgi:tetratricopeptide (TPR) repeat protein